MACLGPLLSSSNEEKKHQQIIKTTQSLCLLCHSLSCLCCCKCQQNLWRVNCKFDQRCIYRQMKVANSDKMKTWQDAKWHLQSGNVPFSKNSTQTDGVGKIWECFDTFKLIIHKRTCQSDGKTISKSDSSDSLSFALHHLLTRVIGRAKTGSDDFQLPRFYPDCGIRVPAAPVLR